MFKPETIPANADVIFMKHILHDWSDAHCVDILKSCHAALKGDDCKVIVVDSVLPAPGICGYQYTYIYMYIYVCMYVCVCVCIYVYMYTCVTMHLYV